MTAAVANRPSLFAREDTIFGACEGLGEDFGFNAQYLRVVLAGLIFFSPLVAVGAYAAIAVAVFSSRMLFPNRKPKSAAAAEPVALVNQNDAAPLAMAA